MASSHVDAEAALAIVASTMRASSTMVVVFDRQLRIVEWNSVTETLTGIQRSAAVGRTFAEVLPDRVGSLPERAIIRAVEHGETFDDPANVRPDPRGGAPRVSELKIVPVRDARMAIAGALVMARDVTGATADERALRESEERYAKLFASPSVIQLLVDPATRRIVDANPAAVRFYGYDQSTMRGLPVATISPEENDEESIALRLERATRGEQHTFLRRHRTSDGERRDVESHVSLIDIGGRPFFHLTINDITHRLRAERDREMMVDVFSEASDMIGIGGPGDVIKYLNPAGRRLLGIDEVGDGHGGEPFRISDYLDDANRALVFDTVLPHAAREGSWRGDLDLRTTRGKTVRCSLTVVPHFEHGTIDSFAAIVRDVTEERELRRRLDVARVEAQRASEAKSVFLANLSHELRTPLNTVLGFSAFLLGGAPGPLTDRQREYLGDVVSATRHLTRLVGDMLDLARIESGTFELRPEQVSLATIVEECRVVLEELATRKLITVTTQLDDAPDQLVLDPDRLRQVLLNLLSNALKFTASGGRVVLTVTSPDSEHVRFEIADTGVGMSREQQQSLFREFRHMAPETIADEGGAGLGLALTKRIVEAQHGTIEVTSRPGRGTMVAVVLPRVRQ